MIPVFHVILKGHVQSLRQEYKNNLWRIQDFPFWAKNQLFGKNFEKNCMKRKEVALAVGRP